jgi:hypothetical protein
MRRIQPCRELVDAAKETHERIFAVRSGAEKPVQERAVARQ